MTVDPDTQVRYEHARANLWAAICKANPQLALPGLDESVDGGTDRLVEPRLASGAEPRCALDGTGTTLAAPVVQPLPRLSPGQGGGSAPTQKTSAPAVRSSQDDAAGAN